MAVKTTKAIARFFRGLAFRREKSAETPRTGDYTGFFNGMFAAGDMSVSTVYACVKLLSDSVASLPLLPEVRRGGIYVADDSSPLGYLLSVCPNAMENAYDFKRRMVMEMLMEGNAYVIPEYGDPSKPFDITAMTLAERGTVTLTPEGDYMYKCKRYTPDSIIHVKNMPDAFDPRLGVSVLTHARQAMNIAAAGSAETLLRFAKGGAVRGLISNEKTSYGFNKISDENKERIAESLDRRINEMGERIVSTPADSKFTPFSMTSTDMEFLATRKFEVREICRFFMVNPSLIFDDTSNNYKSAENASVDFLNKTLNPLLRAIETEFQAKLVSPRLWLKRRVRFDRSELHVCDLMTRVQWQTARLGAGLATPNELRHEENRPAVPGGDELLVSANLKTMAALAAESAGNVGVDDNSNSSDNSDNSNE